MLSRPYLMAVTAEMKLTFCYLYVNIVYEKSYVLGI